MEPDLVLIDKAKLEHIKNVLEQKIFRCCVCQTTPNKDQWMTAKCRHMLCDKCAAAMKATAGRRQVCCPICRLPAVFEKLYG
jgi:hypothetical protein